MNYKNEDLHHYFETQYKSNNLYKWINLANQPEWFYSNSNQSRKVLELLIKTHKDKTDEWLYLEQNEIIPPERFDFPYHDIMIEILKEYNQLHKFRMIDIDLSEKTDYKRKYPYYESHPLMMGDTSRYFTNDLDKIKSIKTLNDLNSKMFLCILGRHTRERDDMYDFIKNTNIIEDTFISYSSAYRFDYPTVSNTRYTRIDKHLDFPVNFSLDTSSYSYEDIKSMGSHALGRPISNLYFKSFCNIICESKFLTSNNLIQLTEKTDKSLFTLQPFVIMGSAHSIKKLKELGFKTFDKWWDESYDNELDDNQRKIKLFETIQYIHSNYNKNYLQIYEEMYDILVHNFNLSIAMWNDKNNYFYPTKNSDLIEVKDNLDISVFKE